MAFSGPGPGRPKGAPNKATRALKEMASAYTEQALQVLADIMVNGETEHARVSAANSILDRAHGKPTQMVGGDKDAEAIALKIVGVGMPDNIPAHD